MKIYYDLLAQNVNFEGLGRFFASGSLEAIADGENVFARYKGGDVKEIYENFSLVKKQDGSQAGGNVTDVVAYLNNEFNQIVSVSGVSETTSTIQTKRPLKTIVGQSLEGIGNILLSKSDVGLSNVQNTDTTTTANIIDSSNKRFVTDTDLAKIGNTSGTNTGDEITSSIQTKRPLKTVNGNSIEGTGDIIISGGGGNKPILTLVKSNATTITETVIARWAIPANSITVLSSILARVKFQAGGTATSIWRLRIGATGTITDTLLSQCTTSVAQVANAQGGGEFVVEFPTTTSAIGSGFAIMQNAILGTTTGAGVAATILPASIVYIAVTMQLSAINSSITKACLANWNS